MNSTLPPSRPQSTTTPASAQVALGVLLIVMFGLLAFRGYGNRLGARPTTSTTPALTDLNRADRSELEQVPGVGPALAQQIILHREKNGPFRSLAELHQVKGIGPATLNKLQPYLQVEASTEPPASSALPEPMYLTRKPSEPPIRVIGSIPTASGAVAKLQPGDPPLNLNTAGLEELVRLPGVGAITARNILMAREQQPFTSIEDLDRVKGIGPKTLEKIRPYVVVK